MGKVGDSPVHDFEAEGDAFHPDKRDYFILFPEQDTVKEVKKCLLQFSGAPGGIVE